MQIRVRLFSVLRERAGTADERLEVPPGSDVSGALGALRRRFPALGPLLDGSQALPLQFAVNREFAPRHVRLQDGDELAVFPPVSGGSGVRTMPGGAVSRPSDPLVGLLLLSGGFDSPVAGHVVQAGGRRLDAVHFTMEPFTDDASARKARALAHRLGIERLLVVPLGEDLAVFTRQCQHRFYFVLLKRLMVRVAQTLAERHGASFLVTGENLGQVSSQTLSNMGVIDAVATLPILRPLLGLDKQDIIRMARRIGTYETSRGPELCDLLGPRHPVTFSELAQILAEEAKVDVAGLVANAIRKSHLEAPTRDELLQATGAAC